MKKIIKITFLLAIMLMGTTVIAEADVGDVPEVINGYVGDYLDLEDEYDVYVYDIEDDYIYDDDGCFLHKGTTTVSFCDDDDNYGEATVKVTYDPSLRLVGDEWWYSSSGKYYYMYVHNISAKTVTVTNSTAYYIRTNKKSENKKFKLTKSSVKIAPRECKLLKFKRVSGKIAYMPCTNKAYMKFKVKYNGKTYTVKLLHDDVDFYRLSGSKWKFIDLRADYDCFIGDDYEDEED